LGTLKKKQCYPNITYERPQFDLPVLYEDDHIAVINKPAGITVYNDSRKSNNKNSNNNNRRTVHMALPFVLCPPKKGTKGGILRRPGAPHRLDKPTSGLMVVAKTKVAMVSLYEQFRKRQIQKIYTAIINGNPLLQLTQQEERKQHYHGDDIINNNDDDDEWNLINYPLGGKYAITSWKVLRQSQSYNANKDSMISMIQIRLHTGRYHQIRRHFAWIVRRPLVGDHLYVPQRIQAHHFRKRGLYLCSNGIAFQHPISGKRTEITIDIPKRFEKLMNAEENWAVSLSNRNNIFSLPNLIAKQ